MIVDQVHHLLAGTVREQRQSLNQLKFLSNELRMPVIAHGTSEALYAMQADPQIASRFEPMALPRWRESVGLREFVVKDSEVVEYALSRTLSPALVVQCQTQLPDKQMLAAKLHEFYALNAPEPPRPRKHPARGPRTQVGDCAHVCG
jgi:hypothetical protein